ncbi:helix-turn-helix domain-containing protein [Actinopolymorpha sp. B9G3]|uniref:helix-turn-helix domain-containing protein n=1 Tax=Actinopolymorpha sp. B9G3 TaxID=3158970 RepID=UPI0032D94943
MRTTESPHDPSWEVRMLEAAGVSTEEERVYRLLVTSFETEPGRIAKRHGLEAGETLRILESLHAKGLVSRMSGPTPRFAPTPPDVGFGPLLLKGQESLEWARSAVAQLTEEYRSSARRRDAGQLVEVLAGAPAIRQQLRNLQLGAREELVWFCKAGHVAMTSNDNTEEFDALAAGVRYRVLYERALLEEPGMLENVAEGIRHGEVARATADLPVRLVIADRSIAICPLVPVADGPGEPTAALVRESSLLAALLALFESYWDRGSPVRLTESRPGDPDAEDERYLLSLLVAGVTDKAIATQLRISQRTVQRRIHDLMRRTHAQTRMQLAWQVARLGWLDAPGSTSVEGDLP